MNVPNKTSTQYSVEGNGQLCLVGRSFVLIHSFALIVYAKRLTVIVCSSDFTFSSCHVVVVVVHCVSKRITSQFLFIYLYKRLHLIQSYTRMYRTERARPLTLASNQNPSELVHRFKLLFFQQIRIISYDNDASHHESELNSVIKLFHHFKLIRVLFAKFE